MDASSRTSATRCSSSPTPLPPRRGSCGATVNIAARLTSLARPGTVLVDDGMREELEDSPVWSLRRVPRASVKGYSSLRPWALRDRD